MKTMKTRTLGLLASCVALAAAALLPTPSQAQEHQPLRVILPLSAGSGVDVIARSAQNALSQALGGQAVVIENLPGAGGITGTQNLVRAAADGSTVAIVSNNHAVNPSVFKTMPYDSQKDITPITVIGGSPFIFVVNPKVPARDAKQLQAYLLSKPDELNYGSSGNGTILQLAAEMFIQAAGAQVRHIPYRGTGPMVADIIGGQVEMGVASLDAVQSQLRAGTLHAIGVMGTERLPSMPDIPTFIEQGFPSVNVAGWFALVGPKGLAPETVQRLRDGFVQGFNDPQVKVGLTSRENFLILNTPEQAAAFLKEEQERYAELVRKAHVTVN